MNVEDRARFAWEALVKRDEEKYARYGFGITDSDVLDVIDSWSTGSCEDGCRHSSCCDYARLSDLVWAAVEAADRA